MNTRFNLISVSYLVGYYGFAARVVAQYGPVSLVVVSGGLRWVDGEDVKGTRASALSEYARRKPAKVRKVAA